MNELNIIDYTIIIGYIAIMMCIGLYGLKKRKNIEEFYVGGRKTGTFTLGCLWMSSWIGGATVVGSVDKAYEIGISSMWYCMSMAVGCIIFAITSAPLIQRLGAKFSCLTYPELIEQRYGPLARFLATITTLLAYIAYTAGQFLAMAFIIKTAFSLDQNTAIWISAMSMVIYTAFGGFLAVSITSTIQALIILLSIVCVLTPLLWSKVDGIEGLILSLPQSFFEPTAWGVGKVVGIVVSIVLTFYTSMDSYTRCFAAKDAKSSQRGAFVAAFMVASIALGTCFIGLAAKQLIPQLPANETVMSAMIFTYLPAGLKGFILVGLLAAIMSTGSVCLLVASANITQDIYLRFIAPKASIKVRIVMGSTSTLFAGVLACYLAIAKQNVIEVLYIAFTINSASLFVPTIAAFIWDKGNAKTAVISMALSLGTVIFWYIGQIMWPNEYIFCIDPVWPGLFVSSTAFLAGAYMYPLAHLDLARCKVFNAPRVI